MTVTGPRLLLILAAGFGLWAVCFVVIYAVQGLGCAYGWHALSIGPVSLLRALLLVLAVAGTLATWIMASQLSHIYKVQQTSGVATFVFRVAGHAACWAVPATIFTFSGVLMASICN